MTFNRKTGVAERSSVHFHCNLYEYRFTPGWLGLEVCDRTQRYRSPDQLLIRERSSVTMRGADRNCKQRRENTTGIDTCRWLFYEGAVLCIGLYLCHFVTFLSRILLWIGFHA